MTQAGKYLKQRVRISQLKVHDDTSTSEVGGQSPVTTHDSEHTTSSTSSSNTRPTCTASSRNVVPVDAVTTAAESTPGSSCSPVADDLFSTRHSQCCHSSSSNQSSSSPSCNMSTNSTSTIIESTMTDSSNASHVQDQAEDYLHLQELLKLPELRPPSVLPSGNVGTPDTVLIDLIAQCRFPPRLITKLGLSFPKMKKAHQYASVPFQYESLMTSTNRRQQRLQQLQKRSTNQPPPSELHRSHLSVSGNAAAAGAVGAAAGGGVRLLRDSDSSGKTVHLV